MFILSHLPLKDSGKGFGINDKIIHFTEYAVFGYLLIRFFNLVKGRDINRSAFLSLIAGSLFAVSDEIHQGFVGYFDSGIFGGIRNPDPFDFAADAVGISIICIISIILNKNSSIKTKLQE